MLRFWRFLAVVLAALALTMTSAHVLELPQKMQYDQQLYSAVNTTMYKYFAIIGGIYSMGSIVVAGILAYFVRKHRLAFRWALAGTLLLVIWFISWLTVVAPVNNQVAAALEATPEAVPALWMQLRERWEYGHALGFVIQLFGFCAIVISVLVDMPPAVES
ncbi:MAG: DUF1772 domain-containing protein [Candidatus Binatia bacterium]